MDECFRADHLLLLVGGNPLPNAVAGKLLIARQGGIITLVHSVGSFQVANRLREWFFKEVPVQRVLLKQINESDPASITQGVFDVLNEVGAVETVGLNYTGGTKAMSVYACGAVEHWVGQEHSKGRSVKNTFSYLSAHRLEMVCDRAGPMKGQLGWAQSINIGLAVKLKLKDLLDLHGWAIQHDPTKQPVLPQSAQALAAACGEDVSFLAWKKEWVQGELRVKCRRTDKDDWRSKSQLQSVTLSLSQNPSLVGVVRIMRRELNLSSSDLALSQAAFGNDPRDFCRWLDGRWLEHYVLSVLNGLAPDLHIQECAQNIETGEVQFDVDVIAMRGYQLFAFSCSTDCEKGLLKSKLFEAYIRARQLGGDEARVALVCCTDDPDRLQHEMRRDVDPEGRIRIFGRRDIVDLSSRVAEWIHSQCVEEGEPRCS